MEFLTVLLKVLWTAAVLTFLGALWYGIWQLFLRHIPALANLKAVICGERRMNAPPVKRGVVFKNANASLAADTQPQQQQQQQQKQQATQERRTTARKEE